MTDDGSHLGSLPLEGFHQKARDGALHVWGLTNPVGVYEPIEPEYWSNHYVDFLGLLREGHTRTKAINQVVLGRIYSDIMVCRAEFEREWPSSSRATIQ